MFLGCEILFRQPKGYQGGSPLRSRTPVIQGVVESNSDTPARRLDVTRLAADEALDPGQTRPPLKITETRKPSNEPLCLAALQPAITKLVASDYSAANCKLRAHQGRHNLRRDAAVRERSRIGTYR